MILLHINIALYIFLSLSFDMPEIYFSFYFIQNFSLGF